MFVEFLKEKAHRAAVLAHQQGGRRCVDDAAAWAELTQVAGWARGGCAGAWGRANRLPGPAPVPRGCEFAAYTCGF